jgi:hypothetical protein
MSQSARLVAPPGLRALLDQVDLREATVDPVLKVLPDPQALRDQSVQDLWDFSLPHMISPVLSQFQPASQL